MSLQAATRARACAWAARPKLSARPLSLLRGALSALARTDALALLIARTAGGLARSIAR